MDSIFSTAFLQPPANELQFVGNDFDSGLIVEQQPACNVALKSAAQLESPIGFDKVPKNGSEFFLSRVLVFNKIPPSTDPNWFHVEFCSKFGEVAMMEFGIQEYTNSDVVRFGAIVGWFDSRSSRKCFEDLHGSVRFLSLEEANVSKHEIFKFENIYLKSFNLNKAELINHLSILYGDIEFLENITDSNEIFMLQFYDLRSLQKCMKNSIDGFIKLENNYTIYISAKLEDILSLKMPNLSLSSKNFTYENPELKKLSTWKGILKKDYNKELYASHIPTRPYNVINNENIGISNLVAETAKEPLTTISNVPYYNVVDISRIARGLETRTTLMIRNIPNKVDQQMLKEYIDLTNYGTYDFLYLRMDFANHCNVGYCFINFISVEAIITFVKARVGKKWNKFKSEKICDASYANIQGKKGLIEKFKNSNVMIQDPSYRPKLYYCFGPLIGQEQPFPLHGLSNDISFTNL